MAAEARVDTPGTSEGWAGGDGGKVGIECVAAEADADCSKSEMSGGGGSKGRGGSLNAATGV